MLIQSESQSLIEEKYMQRNQVVLHVWPHSYSISKTNNHLEKIHGYKVICS